MLDLDHYDSDQYGVLRVGKQLVMPCIYASSLAENTHDNNDRKRFLVDVCSSKELTLSNKHKVFNGFHMNAPFRRPIKFHGNVMRPETNIYVCSALDSIDIKNAYIIHTEKDDEPMEAHKRDHIYSVLLKGKLRYRLEGMGDQEALIEGDSSLGFSFDYNWRLARHRGDIRAWPVVDAEVLDWHVPHGFLDKDLKECDGMTVRINTHEGPLTLFIHNVWGSYMADMSVNRYLSVLGYRHIDNLCHQMLLTKLVYLTMNKFGLTRQEAFKLLNVYTDEVWPVTGEGWSTFDNPPTAIYPKTTLWDKTQYKLIGEDMFGREYPEKQKDMDTFFSLHPITKDAFDDLDFLWSRDLTIEDLYTDRKELMRYPRQSIYDKITKFIPREEIPQRLLDRCADNSRWEYSGLYREYDWMGTWTRQNSKPVYCEMLVRLGILPCLPRVTLEWPYRKYTSTWLSAYSMKTRPVAVFQLKNIDSNEDGWRKLEEAVGYGLDRERIKDELESAIPDGQSKDAAIFVLGVVELTPRTKEHLLTMCKETLGENFVVL